MRLSKACRSPSRAAHTGVHEMVAANYDPQQAPYRIPQARSLAQIREFFADRTGPVRTLELGVGSGTLALKLTELPHDFEFTGVDVSQRMLDRARELVPMRTIRASAADAGAHLEKESFDLIVAHYLLAYVPLRRILESCGPLLARDGALSIITTTNQSIHDPESGLNDVIARLQRSRNPIRRFGARSMLLGLERNAIPNDTHEIASDLKAHGFTIRSNESGRYPMTIQNRDEAYKFCIEDGWFANAIPFERLPPAIALPTIRQMMRFGVYPVRWPHVVDVVLAGKLP